MDVFATFWVALASWIIFNIANFSQIKDEANKLGINLGSSSWSIIDKNERIAIYENAKQKAITNFCWMKI